MSQQNYPRSAALGSTVITASTKRVRDARMDFLKAAARELEGDPCNAEKATAVLGAARAWAKAERDAMNPNTRHALERDTLAASALDASSGDREEP